MKPKAFPGARLLPVLQALQTLERASTRRLHAQLDGWPLKTVQKAVENAARWRYVEACGREVRAKASAQRGFPGYVWRLTALGRLRLGDEGQ